MERTQSGVLEDQSLPIGPRRRAGHDRFARQTFRHRGQQHDRSTGRLRRQRRHNTAGNHAGCGDGLPSAGVRLSGGSNALYLNGAWRRTDNVAIGLRAGLHGKHRGSAGRQCLWNRVEPCHGRLWHDVRDFTLWRRQYRDGHFGRLRAGGGLVRCQQSGALRHGLSGHRLQRHTERKHEPLCPKLGSLQRERQYKPLRW